MQIEQSLFFSICLSESTNFAVNPTSSNCKWCPIFLASQKVDLYFSHQETSVLTWLSRQRSLNGRIGSLKIHVGSCAPQCATIATIMCYLFQVEVGEYAKLLVTVSDCLLFESGVVNARC